MIRETSATTLSDIGRPPAEPDSFIGDVRDANPLWNDVLARASQGVKRSSRSVTPEIEVVMQNALRLSSVLQNYECPDVRDVFLYLTERPELVQLLEDAPVAIRRIYGPCELKLEVLHDTEEGWSRLFLVVRSQMDSDALLAAAERFAESWIQPRLSTFASAGFSITEEPM